MSGPEGAGRSFEQVVWDFRGKGSKDISMFTCRN